MRFGVNRLDSRKARWSERVCKMVCRNVGMMYRRVAKLRLNCSSIFVGPLLCRLSVGRLLAIRVVRLVQRYVFLTRDGCRIAVVSLSVVVCMVIEQLLDVGRAVIV